MNEVKKLETSKIYQLAINNGFVDLATAINKVMTEDYNNTDFIVDDFIRATPGRRSTASDIFDRSAKILTKIYNLLASAMGANPITEADDTQSNTPTNTCINICIKRSETT